MGLLPISVLVDALEARSPIRETECRPVIIILDFASLSNRVAPVEKSEEAGF